MVLKFFEADLNRIPKSTFAMVTVDNGGYDTIALRIVPTQLPTSGEILVKVLAAGVNQ